MVELASCLLSADVISADRLEVRNEVTSSWSGEVRVLPLGIVVQNNHVNVVDPVPRGDD